MLYQLSHVRVRPGTDSGTGTAPHPWGGGTVPFERTTGFEPATLTLAR